MALRKIIEEGDPALNRVARPVTRFDERLAELAEDMLETMYENNGIGLAANQIAVLRRIFVMDIGTEEEPEPMVFVNPEIYEREGEQEYLEGCLSIPGLYGYVKRPAKIKLRYQTVSGEEKTLAADGLKAVCIAHEIDHLDGILFRSKARDDLKPLSAFEAGSRAGTNERV
ncbi:MAG: peptide deformylase [Eubacteriales bacterium]|nr:peptide deformylase [Eubacteriales bacterium]